MDVISRARADEDIRTRRKRSRLIAGLPPSFSRKAGGSTRPLRLPEQPTTRFLCRHHLPPGLFCRLRFAQPTAVLFRIRAWPCPPSTTARCSHDDGLPARQHLQTAVSCRAESQWQWHRLCSRLVPPARKRHELPQIMSPSGNASHAPLLFPCRTQILAWKTLVLAGGRQRVYKTASFRRWLGEGK